MATASDLQQLYIGYFGRAADQEGLNFWLGAINNDGLSLDNVHAAFVNSAEYNAQYEGLTLTQKVAAVYQNVLGRAADTEGAAFWTKAIEDGTITEDQLIEALLSGLSTKDAQAISNKIVVANYYTSAKGDAYVEASKAESGAIIKAVTDKLDTVGSALTKVGEVVGVSNAELATALNALQAAEKAQVEVAKAFLGATAIEGKTDAEILALANDVTTGIQAKAEAALIGAGPESVATAAGKIDTSITLSIGDTAAATAAKIKLIQDKAATDVSTARAEAAKTPGLPELVTKFNAQAKVAADAAAAKTTAAIAQTAELASFAVINGSAAATPNAQGEITGVLKVVSGQLVVDPAYATANAADAAKLKAADDLLVDVKASVAANTADTNAKAALDVLGGQIVTATAGNTVPDTYAAGVLTEVNGVAAKLNAEVKEQADLVKAVEAYNKAALPAADYAAANKSVFDAGNAIFSAAGLGYTEIKLATADAGVDVGLTSKEVFVFDSAVTGSITDLSISKGDVLYVGSNYKLGAAEAYSGAASDKIAGGDNNALEVFFIQKNATTVDVVIEKAVFGSGTGGAADIATITLSGVTSIDKVSFDAQAGLVTFADVA